MCPAGRRHRRAVVVAGRRRPPRWHRDHIPAAVAGGICRGNDDGPGAKKGGERSPPPRPFRTPAPLQTLLPPVPPARVRPNVFARLAFAATPRPRAPGDPPSSPAVATAAAPPAREPSRTHSSSTVAGMAPARPRHCGVVRRHRCQPPCRRRGPPRRRRRGAAAVTVVAWGAGGRVQVTPTCCVADPPSTLSPPPAPPTTFPVGATAAAAVAAESPGTTAVPSLLGARRRRHRVGAPATATTAMPASAVRAADGCKCRQRGGGQPALTALTAARAGGVLAAAGVGGVGVGAAVSAVATACGRSGRGGGVVAAVAAVAASDGRTAGGGRGRHQGCSVREWPRAGARTAPGSAPFFCQHGGGVDPVSALSFSECRGHDERPCTVCVHTTTHLKCV